MTAWSGSSLSYDLNGNLTNDWTNSYTWNARNQLVSMSGGVSAAFVYDGISRRVSRVVGGTTTQYLYDGANAVQELDGTLKPTANLIASLSVDEPLQRTDSSGSVVLLADALGSIVALADSSGALATSYTYEPFGAVVTSGSSSTNGAPFTGRENDTSGVFFYRARYYIPRSVVSYQKIRLNLSARIPLASVAASTSMPTS